MKQAFGFFEAALASPAGHMTTAETAAIDASDRIEVILFILITSLFSFEASLISIVHIVGDEALIWVKLKHANTGSDDEIIR